MLARNQQICQIFQQLYILRTQQGEVYRAKAYEKVIPILQNYHKEIESGAEARLIPGIGEKLAAKIDEILRTGTVVELGNPVVQTEKEKEKEEVLKLFQSIERVGEKTALKWYNTGYRKLSDIPASECNAGQWLGIQLHHELIQRIPREEVKQFEQIFHYYLDPLKIQFVICGSYRRGKADSGDIDILVIAQPNINVLAEVLRVPVFTHTLAYGDKKYLGICRIGQLHRRIDIELVQPDEYPFAVVYFTGPAKFNVLMRQQAINLGGRLNEKSLSKTFQRTDINTYIDQLGKTHTVENTVPHTLNYYAKTEEDVFSLLGIQYLTPEERERYA